MDILLVSLRDAGVGCFIGESFVAALAYADDIVLLAPYGSRNALPVINLQQICRDGRDIFENIENIGYF